jgi:predicted nuclease of restriction endonuclease-like (RecB) superfamily
MVDYDIIRVLKNHVGYKCWDDVPALEKEYCYKDYNSKKIFPCGIHAKKIIEHGWSRSILTIWIENDLYRREGKAITNFKTTLPAPQSDLAQQTLKDPYVFDFLTLHKEHLEKDLEDGLVNHIQKFLIELGQGFAFMGRQYLLNVSGHPFYIDLLFYHDKLRSFFVVELKIGRAHV